MKLQKLTTAWFNFNDYLKEKALEEKKGKGKKGKEKQEPVLDPDNPRFEIKHLLSGEISQISEVASKQRYEFKDDEDGEMVPIRIVEPNRSQERELMIIGAVTNWEGVFDENGEPLACTDANKKRACREQSEKDFIVFVEFVQACRNKLREQIEKRETAKQGN